MLVLYEEKITLLYKTFHLLTIFKNMFFEFSQISEFNQTARFVQ